MKRTTFWSPRWAWWITLGLVLLYLYSSLIPFDLDWSGCRWDRVSWIPFREGATHGAGLQFSLSNALVNWGAGLPLGWFGFLACPRRWPAPLTWLLVVGLAILAGLGMEVLQLLVPDRQVSMTDVVNIGLGGGCGAVAACWFAEPLAGRVLSSSCARPERFTLLLLLGFVALRSFFPSSVATSLGDLKQTVGHANVIPGEFPHRHLFAQLGSVGLQVPGYGDIVTYPRLTRTQYACSLLGHFLLYGLLGGVLQRSWSSRSWLALVQATLAVGLLAAAVELLQVFFPGQAVDINVALVGLAGGLVGALAAMSLGRHPGLLRLLCLFAVVAYIATQYLRPGDGWLGRFEPRLGLEAVIPLYHYWVGANQVEIFLDMINGVGLFVPIGWLLAEWARKRGSGRALAVGACLGLALVLEIVQSGLGRVASIDDVIWAGLGGWVGGWLQNRVGQGGASYESLPQSK